MKRLVLFFLLCICSCYLFGQNETIKYTLNHRANSEKLEITIALDSANTNTTFLFIPRSGPGTYDLTNYLAFVDNVKGYTRSNKVLKGQLGRPSAFFFKEADEVLTKVTYEVDVAKMEMELLGGFASTKLREHYLGILGYSVFGFLSDLEDKPIALEINSEQNWPIFSTLKPSVDKPLGTANYTVDNYAQLADAQYLLGTGLQLIKVENAPIPLYVAAYAETEIDMEEIGRRGLLALSGLADYFGYIPMPHYTICYELLKPKSSKHDYGFSMEHLNSMTSSFEVSEAIKAYDASANIGSMVHHIGHSWVPLRSYGVGYRPFEWQIAPLIETIWLNEGFTWYVSNYNVLNNKNIIQLFESIVYKAPSYIKNKSLKELSLLGSTQYSLDFNIGRSLYSRGALMAYDLDILIQKETKGEKSFKDVMLTLLKWTETNQRAFKYDEIPVIISEGVGIDISTVWEKWQKPIEN